MKIVNNLFLKKFLIVFLVFIMLLNFLIPTRVYAFDIGGVLFWPFAQIIAAVIDGINSVASLAFKGGQMYDQTEGGVNVLMSPEEIFSGSIGFVDANIFTASDRVSHLGPILNGGKIDNIAGTLKVTVAGIYELLRNFCAIVMLCMLIYTGIRIVLASSSASEKKEWKMRMMDWLKALLLLIFMHVIMISVFYVSDVIVDALGNSGGLNISAQLRKAIFGSANFMQTVVLLILYGYTTYLTFVFLISYMKRLFWIVILIVIAPIVSVMYCFGKEGKTIFHKWFKEYTLAVLIQPYHFIVYYVLVSIPLGMARNAGGTWYLPDLTGGYQQLPIYVYCLIGISCIRPFEKFLRDLFGMNGKVANQASFESGKQTLDTAKNAVMDAAKVAGALYTGNIGGAISTVSNTANKAENNMDGAQGQVGGNSTPVNNQLEAGSDTSDATERTLNSTTVESTAQAIAESTSQSTAESTSQSTAEASSMSSEEKEGLEEMGSSTVKKSARERFRDFSNSIGSGDFFDNWAEKRENGRINSKLRGWGNEESRMGRGINKVGNWIADRRIAGISGTGYLLTNEEGRNKLNAARASLHRFTDTMYMPGDASGDWKGGVERFNDNTKERFNATLNNFVNNKNNINAIIESRGLLDKHLALNGDGNKAKALSGAEAEAKEILKGAEPFIRKGIEDFGTIDKLLLRQKETGGSAEQVIKQQLRIESFNRNENKVSSTINAIAKLTEGKEQVSKETVKQKVEPYVAEGVTDPKLLAKLTQLEGKLDKVENMSPKGVMGVNQIIQKAMKDGMKEIKIPQNASASMKAVQKVINDELKNGLSSGAKVVTKKQEISSGSKKDAQKQELPSGASSTDK